MLNNTLMAVKTSRLFHPRINPENRISRDDWPDPEPGPYRSRESRLRSGKVTENGKLPNSICVDLQKEFWDIGIQAIIQISSIDLDHERPEYPGEDWHVQGQLVSTPDSHTSTLGIDKQLIERTHLCYRHVLLQQREHSRGVDILPQSL